MTYNGGYIKDGVYYPRKAPVGEMKTSNTPMFKSGDHDRQRKDFAKEIVQPFKDGKPNEDFIQAFPEESRQYGFIPTIDQIKETQ